MAGAMSPSSEEEFPKNGHNVFLICLGTPWGHVLHPHHLRGFLRAQFCLLPQTRTSLRAGAISIHLLGVPHHTLCVHGVVLDSWNKWTVSFLEWC